MNTVIKGKRVKTVAAALVIAGALVAGSATAASAAYPPAPSVSVSVASTPAAARANVSFTYKVKAEKGAKVVISYVKASSLSKAKKAKKATKLKSYTAKKSSAVSSKLKIKKTGTYYVKITVTKKGEASKVVYKKIKVKAKK
jgi:uncharacterized protein (DUF58 family)